MYQTARKCPTEAQVCPHWPGSSSSRRMSWVGCRALSHIFLQDGVWRDPHDGDQGSQGSGTVQPQWLQLSQLPGLSSCHWARWPHWLCRCSAGIWPRACSVSSLGPRHTRWSSSGSECSTADPHILNLSPHLSSYQWRFATETAGSNPGNLYSSSWIFSLSETESHSVLSEFLSAHGLYSPWNPPGQKSGVGSLFLLQGIFPTQGSNPGLPHCRQILYQLSRTGSPKILEWVAYPFCSRSSQPRNWTRVSCTAGGFFTIWARREAHSHLNQSHCWMLWGRWLSSAFMVEETKAMSSVYFLLSRTPVEDTADMAPCPGDVLSIRRPGHSCIICIYRDTHDRPNATE